MQALVYHGPGAKAREEIADPKLAAALMPSSRWTPRPSVAPISTS
jgi:hypothetical protein